VPEAANSTSPAGACSNFRMAFDQRHFSHYEYPSLCDRLRIHDDPRSSNHSMVVIGSHKSSDGAARAKVRGALCTHVADLRSCLLFE
jgi:hypothetical protein